MSLCRCSPKTYSCNFNLLLNFIVLLTIYGLPLVHLRRPSFSKCTANTRLNANNFNNLHENSKLSILKTSLVTINGISSILILNSLQSNVNAVDTESINYIPSNNIITRDKVGFINLNETLPKVTDVAWMDIKIGEGDPQRIEISLFGEVCPKTVENFKLLCQNINGYGYKDSNIFRVISQFSIQGGSILESNDQGTPTTINPSKLSKYGKAAINNGQPFPQENFRILHSYKTAGVISMMKDITNKGYQDSRFFITLKEYASWADEKYTAFGIVTKGMNYIQGMTIVPVEAPANYPKSAIKIIDSGVY